MASSKPVVRLFAPLLALCIPLAARSGEQTVFELDPYPAVPGPVVEQITVTTDGQSRTRVGEEQIHRLGAGDLSAALRRVPGVTISRYNVVGAFGGGDGGAVFIRGHGSGRPGSEIVTLTDGIPRFVGVWTHPLLDTLPTDFAAAIDIHKSPQPVRFGNMAFGAVNLIPARASGTGWSGTLRGEVGSWATHALYADAGFSGEALNLHAGYSHRESDGHRPNANGEVNAFQARAGWRFGNGWEADYLVQYIDSAANDPERKGASLPIVERYEIENQFHLGTLQRVGADWSVVAKVYAEAGDLDWRQWHNPPPPPFPAQTLNTRTFYGNHGLRGRFQFTAGALRMESGIDFDSYGGRVSETYASAPDNRFNEERFHLAMPHARAEWHFSDDQKGRGLVLSAGSRAFLHDVFADKVAWQLGARHSTGQAVLYLNLARSLNYPGVFVSVFGRRPPPWTIGDDWRKLDPETVDHVEAGLSWSHAGKLVLDVAVFNDKVENALRIAPPPPAGRIFNLGDYTLRGAEATLRTSPAKGIDLYAGLTLLDADEGVPNAPGFSVTLGFDWQPAGDWTISGDFQRVDDQEVIDSRFDNPRGTVGAYSLLNARVSRVIRMDSSSIEFYLRGENLLDETYEHRPGYPMPGAALLGGVRLDF